MIEFRKVLLTALAALALGAGMLGSAYAQDGAASSARGEQPAPVARPWKSLDATQRDLLAPLQADWNTLPPRRQAHLLKRAERWGTLPADRREAIRERITRWQQMTPQEREQTRANRGKFHHMSPDQREQLHATFKHFQQLPPAQRSKLIRQWRALTPEQRLHWSVPGNGSAPGATPANPASDQPQRARPAQHLR